MKELELFQVKVCGNANGFMTLAESLDSRNLELLTEIKHASEAPTVAVASSIFMRRFGFFITAQLHLLAHGRMWDGPLEKVHLTRTPGGLAFEVDEQYVRDRRPGDLEAVLKKYAWPVVETFRKSGHVSKLILWENIWGYVIWMYGMLDSAQAKKDVERLLDAEIWQPEMRKSLFRQFLDGKDFQEAKSEYQRITCCLYKELPNTNKCPYCPMNK